MNILETERTYMREMTVHDAENAFVLNSDPEVIKYTGDAPFESVEAARVFLENYDHYRKFGFGRWAVINKSDESFMGWCGLKYTAELDEFDVGFRFLRMYWNRGFATETAKACIGLGFERFQMKEIVGRSMKENYGSIRVLEKCGMTYSGEFDFDGHAGIMFKIVCPPDKII
ncbi:MAG: GNAT family N-acetyltransferase [Flavobacteriales bacterium]|nr:GNAT family N-acetyltransferase [Flavobacteriales bacterium]